MAVLKGCIAADHLSHIEDIDIGVGDEILLADLRLRIHGKQQTSSSQAASSDIENTNQRVQCLMANLHQFGTNVDRLCPALDEVFCLCLHAMVYCTVDVLDHSHSLPSVAKMKVILKQLPVVQGAEVKKKEFAVQVLTAAYRRALDKDLLGVLSVATRKNVLASL
jgi:hypothetical protein